mmetsp:Transcript_42855/g.130332  ORF Transcript_42855/g.130332 Transcript_42855/m.130332 type:complete len:204 (-) Transcript_42855:606-1217(-)
MTVMRRTPPAAWAESGPSSARRGLPRTTTPPNTPPSPHSRSRGGTFASGGATATATTTPSSSPTRARPSGRGTAPRRECRRISPPACANGSGRGCPSFRPWWRSRDGWTFRSTPFPSTMAAALAGAGAGTTTTTTLRNCGSRRGQVPSRACAARTKAKAKAKACRQGTAGPSSPPPSTPCRKYGRLRCRTRTRENSYPRARII